MAYAQITEPCEPIQLGKFLLEETRFPAVYFLYHEGVVVYVGQSKTLRFRIEQHLTEGVKVFDAIAYIHCRVDQLMIIETDYITRLTPIYNACEVAKSVREGRPWRFTSTGKRLYSVEQAALFLGVNTADVMGWRERNLLVKTRRLPRSRSRSRVPCLYWSMEALVRFRDLYPDEISAAQQRAA
jgi:hypothetical protein